MARIARLLGIAIISISSIQCDQTNPTKPTAVEAGRVSAPPRDPFGPVTGGVAQAQRDAFAACLAREGTPACFSASNADAPETRSTSSAFGDCLQGNGGATCFTGESGRRGTVRAAALAPAPSNLTSVVNNQTVMLTWSQPPGETVLFYEIEAGSAPGSANLASFSTGSTATSFTAPGVAAGQYYVRVRAVNASGASGVSNEVVVNVGATGCTAPERPVLRLVSNSGGVVSLAWSVSVFNIRSYVLQAGSFPGIADLANFDLGNAGLQFSTTGVPPGTYYVRVIGRNSCGLGPASNELVISVVPSGGGGGGGGGGGSAGLFVDLDYCDCFQPPGTTHTIRIDGVDRATIDSCARTWSFDVSPGNHTVTDCTTQQQTFCRSLQEFTVGAGQTYQYRVRGNFC